MLSYDRAHTVLILLSTNLCGTSTSRTSYSPSRLVPHRRYTSNRTLRHPNRRRIGESCSVGTRTSHRAILITEVHPLLVRVPINVVQLPRQFSSHLVFQLLSLAHLSKGRVLAALPRTYVQTRMRWHHVTCVGAVYWQINNIILRVTRVASNTRL